MMKGWNVRKSKFAVISDGIYHGNEDGTGNNRMYTEHAVGW
jgi:hypothetical protein